MSLNLSRSGSNRLLLAQSCAKRIDGKASHRRRRSGLTLLSGALRLAFVLAWLGLPATALAINPTYEGFDYSTGSLEGEDGGSGEWKDKWSGDSQLQVKSPGLTHGDTSGNELVVDGNRLGTSSNSTKKSVRPLNNKVGEGTETVWVSVIIDGSGGNKRNNLSLGDGLFIGQGTKDSGTDRLGLSDADGLLDESGTTPDDPHFLVVRVDFSGGDEDAWLWIDPSLASEPSVGDADAESNSVKEFSFDYVQIQMQRSSGTGIDEIRLGSTFSDVLPYTSSAVCGNGSIEAGEACDDGNTVPGDCCSATCGLEAAGSTCGDGATTCSGQDACDGEGTCELNHLVDSTTCGDAGDECTNQDYCDGGGLCADAGFIAAATSCGDGATTCSGQDACDGAGTCAVNHLADDISCGDDGDECTNQDYCDGGGSCGDSGFALAGTSCGDPGDQCTNPDSCDFSGSCIDAGWVSEGSVCSDEDPETFNDQCSAGVCEGSGSAPVPAASLPIRVVLVLALLGSGMLVRRAQSVRRPRKP